MSVSVKVYDWPQVLTGGQLFFAGGQSAEGGFTSGGARVSYPEPGGRSFLDLEFTYQHNAPPDPLISWAMSKIANGNVFRIPLHKTPQLISAGDLGLVENDAGVPWGANGLIQEHPWDNGQNWASVVGAVSAFAALEGAVELVIDVGDLPAALRPGHVIGIGDTPYIIGDIDWDASVATLEIDPPLRADAVTGTFVTFRPTMLCVATNPESFRSTYRPADIIQPGPVRFIEAIL